MVWMCDKGRGGVGWGGGGKSLGTMASRKALEKVKWVCKGEFCAESMDMGSSHRMSNPILDEKIGTLKENVDDDDDD